MTGPAAGAELFLGLMSGTSMDGVDAVLVDLDAQRFQRVLAHHHQPYPQSLRTRLLHLALDAPALTMAEWVDLDVAVSDCFSDCALALLASAGVGADRIRALGCHGQTVFHRPDGAAPGTLQLMDPNRVAAATGVITVADFRRRDIAEGGQGAPLVPAFHHALFACAEEPRCVANIGGIANVTILPDAREANVRGYDTGPGNALMDEWSLLHRGRPYDENGAWARSGQVNMPLLRALLDDAFIMRATPKSTGRDYFNLGWVRRHEPNLDGLPVADVQRTFCELTAVTIVATAERERCHRLLVCGGGSLNTLLMERLEALFESGSVQSTDLHGLPAMQVEGAAFAWLAMRTMAGQSGNLPGVTGARRRAVLGGIYQAECAAGTQPRFDQHP